MATNSLYQGIIHNWFTDEEWNYSSVERKKRHFVSINSKLCFGVNRRDVLVLKAISVSIQCSSVHNVHPKLMMIPNSCKISNTLSYLDIVIIQDIGPWGLLLIVVCVIVQRWSFSCCWPAGPWLSRKNITLSYDIVPTLPHTRKTAITFLSVTFVYISLEL